jgi:methionyl aminopeptidase
MTRLKNAAQINRIRESCKMLASLFSEIKPLVREGVETIELDDWAYRWVKKAGGKSAFRGIGHKNNPFPGTLCISINDEIIHGIPKKRKLKDGDLVSIDSGIDLGGYISDKSETFEIGIVKGEDHILNEVTRDSLYRGIAAAKAGNRILDIGRAVSEYVMPYNYGIVEDYSGHGVGFDVHEEPSVPNVPHGPNPKMREGLVIAIEPMICIGTGDVELDKDGWTVHTKDRKNAAHWEHTIAIFNDHTEILTEL